MESMLAGLMIALYSAAWLLGWWRMQSSSQEIVMSQEESSRASLFNPKNLAVAISTCVLLGLAAHSIFLVIRVQNWLGQQLSPSGWFVWGMMSSWVLVAGLVLQLNHRRMHVFGLLLLPISIIFFAIGYGIGLPEKLGTDSVGSTAWRWIHAGSLLLGTVAVVFAFAAGVLYMVQSNRLKKKKPSLGFRLPSLEKLQSHGERGLIVSSLALALGLVSGIIMNLFTQTGSPIIDWGHPVVWSSSLLLFWLVSATGFNLLYQPARHGRKVAYLTIVSGLFLALELAVVLFSGHGKQEPTVEDSPVGLSNLTRSFDDIAVTLLVSPQENPSGRAEVSNR